ncbi:DMT family transporter [Raoultibacter phocaeensis]|uniref:DMT family transporter n=1 Tax=Raoultibacter phocaeensis TaxID=2479841 RepID=UPI00111B5D20|nr:DMT family transporter [Raoultibacter phocaeensis]
MSHAEADNSKPKPLWLFKGYLLIAAAIWGMGTVVIKATVDSFPPAWLVGVRFTFAGLILGIVLLPRLKKHLNADHLKKGFVLGVFIFLAYWTNSTGLTDTTASNSAFLTSLYCVIIPFLMWALSGPRPTKFNIAAALVCVAGVGCVSFAGSTDFALRFGDAVTLLSAVFLSFHVVYTSRFASGRDMMALTIIQFVVAGLLGFIAAFAFEPMPDFATLGFDTYISLGYLVVFASCIALLLQNIAVAHVDPAPASLFLATESVFGVVFSIAFLGEVLTGPLFVGFGLIFAGIVVSEYLPLRAERQALARSVANLEGVIERKVEDIEGDMHSSHHRK